MRHYKYQNEIDLLRYNKHERTLTWLNILTKVNHLRGISGIYDKVYQHYYKVIDLWLDNTDENEIFNQHINSLRKG